MSDDALFAAPPVAPAGQARTPGQALRDRQDARIRAGFHPLSFGPARYRLHPDVPRDPAPYRDDEREYPRCGACVFRQSVGGHARNHAKCLIGYERRPYTPEEIAANRGTWQENATHKVTMGPRYSRSAASDVKAWWPACDQYAPREG